MKSISFRLLPMLIIFSLSLSAQINSGVGYMHGTYKKGDTIQDYEENPETHVHEQVKVIKEVKLTPTQAAKITGQRQAGKPTSQPDTAATAMADTVAAAPAPASSNPDTAQAASGMVVAAVSTTGCDCINASLLYNTLGVFVLGFFLSLYLFVVLIRGQKRPPFVSAIHSILITIAMTLLVVYAVFQPFPLPCLFVLVLAGLTSLGLLYYDVTDQPAPRGLAISHGALALIGAILLLIFTLGH